MATANDTKTDPSVPPVTTESEPRKKPKKKPKPNYEAMDFDSGEDAGKEVSVRYKGKDYVLTEISNEAEIAIQTEQFKTAKMVSDPDKPDQIRIDTSAINPMAVLQADLIMIANCLFEVTDGVRSEQPVGLDFVKGLPKRMTKELIKRCRINSGQTEDGDDPEGLDDPKSPS